jgi:hypothetical protein
MAKVTLLVDATPADPADRIAIAFHILIRKFTDGKKGEAERRNSKNSKWERPRSG